MKIHEVLIIKKFIVSLLEKKIYFDASLLMHGKYNWQYLFYHEKKKSLKNRIINLLKTSLKILEKKR